MDFLAVLIVFVLERYRGFYPKIQSDQWFFRLEKLGHDWLGRLKIPDVWQAALVIGIPCVLLIQIEDMAEGKLFGVPTLALLVVVLIYSLGRGDFTAQLESYLAHWNSGDLQSAWHLAQEFSPAGDVIDAESAEQLHNYASEALLYQGFERWFCVVFWFAVLGPWSALAYRLARLYGGQTAAADGLRTAGPTTGFIQLMEWLPARLLALSFALVGNFPTTVACWRDQIGSASIGTAPLLHRCALAGLVGDETAATTTDNGNNTASAANLQAGAQIKGLKSLLQRTAVAWLLILAVTVLVFD
jgi:AmpE protein